MQNPHGITLSFDNTSFFRSDIIRDILDDSEALVSGRGWAKCLEGGRIRTPTSIRDRSAAKGRQKGILYLHEWNTTFRSYGFLFSLSVANWNYIYRRSLSLSLVRSSPLGSIHNVPFPNSRHAHPNSTTISRAQSCSLNHRRDSHWMTTKKPRSD